MEGLDHHDLKSLVKIKWELEHISPLSDVDDQEIRDQNNPTQSRVNIKN